MHHIQKFVGFNFIDKAWRASQILTKCTLATRHQFFKKQET